MRAQRKILVQRVIVTWKKKEKKRETLYTYYTTLERFSFHYRKMRTPIIHCRIRIENRYLIENMRAGISSKKATDGFLKKE